MQLRKWLRAEELAEQPEAKESEEERVYIGGIR